MSWRNIRLIYFREIRDQLRDRRTLFMIAVLPMLLYPLLGMSVFQLSQFLRKSEPKVVVVGAQELKGSGDLPPLIENDHFAVGLFSDAESADWLHLEFANGATIEAKVGKAIKPDTPKKKAALEVIDRAQALESAEQRLKSGEVQVVLNFPEEFGKRLRELRAQIKERASGTGNQLAAKTAEPIEIPKPQLSY